MGQTVIFKSKISNDNSIDVSALNTGNYVLKLYSNLRITYGRFIKK
jgi:hypothetical protein